MVPKVSVAFINKDLFLTCPLWIYCSRSCSLEDPGYQGDRGTKDSSHKPDSSEWLSLKKDMPLLTKTRSLLERAWGTELPLLNGTQGCAQPACGV